MPQVLKEFEAAGIAGVGQHPLALGAGTILPAKEAVAIGGLPMRFRSHRFFNHMEPFNRLSAVIAVHRSHVRNPTHHRGTCRARKFVRTFRRSLNSWPANLITIASPLWLRARAAPDVGQRRRAERTPLLASGDGVFHGLAGGFPFLRIVLVHEMALSFFTISVRLSQAQQE